VYQDLLAEGVFFPLPKEFKFFKEYEYEEPPPPVNGNTGSSNI
jgi:hypothetical protein